MTALLCSLNMIVFVPESRRGLRDVESKEFYELSFTSHRAANPCVVTTWCKELLRQGTDRTYMRYLLQVGNITQRMWRKNVVEYR